MTVLNQVREIVALETGRNIVEIQPGTKFIDLGLDSLEMVHLIMELEDAFDVSLKDDELQIFTVQDAVGYIQRAKIA